MTNTENYTGPLKSTKLGTRDNAVQHLAVELGHAHNDNAYQFSMLLVEFDGLSLVTDHLGDSCSNDVLRTVINVLKQDLGTQDTCYRLGGDEFLVIFPTKDASDCRDLMDRFTRRWTGVGTRVADIDVSIGFASSSQQGVTIEGLFASADRTMQKLNRDVVPLDRSAASAGARNVRHAGSGFFADRVAAFAHA